MPPTPAGSTWPPFGSPPASSSSALQSAAQYHLPRHPSPELGAHGAPLPLQLVPILPHLHLYLRSLKSGLLSLAAAPALGCCNNLPMWEDALIRPRPYQVTPSAQAPRNWPHILRRLHPPERPSPSAPKCLRAWSPSHPTAPCRMPSLNSFLSLAPLHSSDPGNRFSLPGKGTKKQDW